MPTLKRLFAHVPGGFITLGLVMVLACLGIAKVIAGPATPTSTGEVLASVVILGLAAMLVGILLTICAIVFGISKARDALNPKTT